MAGVGKRRGYGREREKREKQIYGKWLWRVSIPEGTGAVYKEERRDIYGNETGTCYLFRRIAMLDVQGDRVVSDRNLEYGAFGRQGGKR